MRGKRHYAAALSPRAPPGNDGDKGPSLLSFAFDTPNTVGQTKNPTADKYLSESAVWFYYRLCPIYLHKCYVKGLFTNYIYKTRWVGGLKLSTFCQITFIP